jgi:NADH dehydrogenase [ubiquinone] 1 alpha subcomplex assembly factor 7
VSPLEDRLRRLILDHGPISVARYMALALAHPTEGYYPRRDPLGAAGDFITAPEVSQLFGELIGLALVQHWLDLGRPRRMAVCELGPGRGTLMADALRAAKAVPDFIAAMTVHLVETSPALRERQSAAMPGLPVHWHDELAGLPSDRPLLLVANEFLDALPVRQFVRRSGRWHERLIGVDADGALRFVLAPRATPFPQAVGGIEGELADGILLELGPAREAVVEAIAARLVAQGGMALFVDYGSAAAAMTGDTFRAVSRHAAADPLIAPGEVDLSAHVDFHAIAARAAAAGAEAYGPLGQGEFLGRLGIAQRLRRLLRSASPEQRATLESGCERLVAPDAMGELFKVLALTAPGGPVPPGFAEPVRRR